VIVVDEYLAVRVLRAQWPTGLPDDDLALTASRHWRLLQALHGARGGQLSQLFAGAPADVVSAVRWPHPEVLQVLDPRPLLDEAAVLAARFGGTGLLTAETMAAGLAHGASSGSAPEPTSAACSSALPASSASGSTSWLRPEPSSLSRLDSPKSRATDRQIVGYTLAPLMRRCWRSAPGAVAPAQSHATMSWPETVVVYLRDLTATLTRRQNNAFSCSVVTT